MVLLLSVLLSGCSASAMQTNSWSGLSADTENAYLAHGSFIYAIALNNGNLHWKYPAEGADTKEAYFANPVLTDDGQLLIVSAGSNHSLTSLDSANGTANWTFDGAQGAWIASPAVVDGTIYAPNTDGILYVLDMSGNLRWEKEIGGALWSQPVSDGTMLYITSLNHNLYALDLSTQEVAWSLSLNGALPGTAALDEAGNLYAGSFGSKVASIDTQKQAIAWETPIAGWVWDAPVLDGETLYVGDLEGNFHSFDIKTGNENWAAIKPNGPITGSPLVMNDFIVIGTESGSAYAIDREGGIVWQHTIGGRLYTAPVAGNDLILFSPMEIDSILVALDLDGRQVWQFTPEK